MNTHFAGVLVVSTVLGGCTVGPDFHRPDAHAPASWWGTAPADIPSAPTFGGTIDTSWWNEFKDPELSSLETRLARQNLDLQEAAERIEQGRQQRRIAASRGLPNLDGDGTYQRITTPPKLLETLIVPAPNAPVSFDLFQDNVSVAWDVDLFGRVRRAVEARRADTEAVIEARHAVALAAIADLAQDYMQLRGVQSMLLIAQDNLADADRNVRLIRNQFSNGVSTTLDIANAEVQRDTIAANLPPLRANIAALINAVGFLLAEPPRTLERELSSLRAQPPVPPTVPLGIPSDLARRRPDIREAESKLHEATAETGVAVADFYPDLRISGQAGTEALQFPQVFNLASGYTMIGPTLDVPLFEGGRLRATLRLRKSQQREAALNYRNTVLQAWQDVDNALTAYEEAQHRRQQLSAAYGQSQLALAAARQRYRQGVVDFLNVLAAQSALLQNQNGLANANVEVETDLVALYRALGGGWDVADRN